MEIDIVGHCWNCGNGLTRADYGRENRCLRCDSATRCCRNCRLYQAGRPNDCREPLAEPVADKGRANFCEHFDPAPKPTADMPSTGANLSELRQQAEDLFK
jgi:hypothetical protein